MDMIFVAGLVQEKCQKQYSDLYNVSVNFTVAFCRIYSTNVNCPSKIMATLKGFHTWILACVVAGFLYLILLKSIWGKIR